jgi:hypothetical protein
MLNMETLVCITKAGFVLPLYVTKSVRCSNNILVTYYAALYDLNAQQSGLGIVLTPLVWFFIFMQRHIADFFAIRKGKQSKINLISCFS